MPKQLEFAVIRIDGTQGTFLGVIRGKKADEADKAAAESFQGEGEYAVVRWDNRKSFWLSPKPNVEEMKD